MVYSVWNSGSQSFDYFEGLGNTVDGQLPSRTLVGRRQLGMTPEESSARLPPGARKVGSGEFARGVIATRGGLGMGFDLGGLPIQWIVGGVVAALWFFGGRR